MPKLIECIPNFSEGRDQKVIDGLTAVAQSVPGVSLFDVQSDESHNRCVYTLVGSPEGIEEVAFQLAKKAMETAQTSFNAAATQAADAIKKATTV